jgi:hypothetical protein
MIQLDHTHVLALFRRFKPDLGWPQTGPWPQTGVLPAADVGSQFAVVPV